MQVVRFMIQHQILKQRSVFNIGFFKIILWFFLVIVCCLGTYTATLCWRAVRILLMMREPSCSLVCLGLLCWGSSVSYSSENLSPQTLRTWSTYHQGQGVLSSLRIKSALEWTTDKRNFISRQFKWVECCKQLNKYDNLIIYVLFWQWSKWKRKSSTNNK